MIYVYLGNEINILKMKINELISSLDIKNIIEYDYNNTSIREILEEVCYVECRVCIFLPERTSESPNRSDV